ncbi:MAG: hypothetical protein SV377_05580, partial [Halobacteria archaeon]|nr:hypothetical protein [Halobacteria archaeon]
MRRQLLYASFLVIVILISGCSAYLDPSPTSTKPESEVVSGGSDANVGSGLPEGLSQNGITDMDELTEAHRRALEGNSYTYVETYRSDGKGITRVRRISVDETGSYVYKYNRSGLRGNSKIVRWSNGRNVFISYKDGNTSRYLKRMGADDGGDRFFKYVSRLLHKYFSEEDSTVSRTIDRGGKKFVWVTSSKPPSEPEFAGIRNYEAVALIDMSGLVHKVYVEYDRPNIGEPGWTHTNFVFEYTDIGGTDVDRPEWYLKAKNSSLSPRKDIRILQRLGETRVTELEQAPHGFGNLIQGTLDEMHYKGLRNTTYEY